MRDPLQDFKDALGGDVVIPNLDRSGALSATEILATRSWFDRRRHQLASSGGRPTNPSWTLKRQVPLAPATWSTLKSLAASWSDSERRLGPGQVAAFLLEEAVSVVSARPMASGTTSAMPASPATDEDLDPRFRGWRMPEPFSGSTA